MKKLNCIFALGVICFTLAACKSKEPTPLLGNLPIPVENTQAKTVTLDHSLEIGLNAFAYQLHSKLQNEKNLFFSPYSIGIALTMLANGADGGTKQELLDLFQIENLKNWNQQVSLFLSQEQDKKAMLNTANSIWLSKAFSLLDTASSVLLEPLKQYYQADVFETDYRSSKAIHKINNWVSTKTEGMIDPFLSELDEDTVLTLINAVYFNGEWTKKFRGEDTVDLSFYGKTKETTIPMMRQSHQSFRYLEQDGLRLLELPYGDGDIVMNVILPAENREETTAELFSMLSHEQRNALFSNLAKAEPAKISALILPKFELEYGLINLNESLKSLGMVKSFNEIEAEFDQLHPNLFVSLVVHKAKIKVFEEGSVAAAATGVLMGKESAAPPADILEFIVNQPFVFTIQDTKTNTILFLGEVNDL